MSGKLQAPKAGGCSRVSCTGASCANLLPCGLCELDVETYRKLYGELQQETVAWLFRRDVRTIRRDELGGLAKVCGDEQLQTAARDYGILRDVPSARAAAREVLRGGSRPNVRSNREIAESASRDPRAAHLSPPDAPPVARRAGRTLSRRKDPMKIDGKTSCILADLRARLNVSNDDMARLTAAAAAGDFSRFDVELRRIEVSAAPHTAGSEPDAFDLHKDNPHLLAAMKACQVTAADVRKHGAAGQLGARVLPNLRELVAATDARGDAFGKGE